EVSIYVRHDMRGAGVGKILLRHMLERASSLDIRNVIALVFGHNYPSLNLFHRFGFEEWGRLPQVCDLETMLADVVILGKKIVD
ncbi:GNAT family N-acetyltransferase, partial [Neisseria sp. P0001.S004]